MKLTETKRLLIEYATEKRRYIHEKANTFQNDIKKTELRQWASLRKWRNPLMM